jgi:hypothetical protein
MTLAELLSTLEEREALKKGRVKDLRTSLRYLSHALGHDDIDTAPLCDTCKDPSLWTGALTTHFAGLGAEGRAVSDQTKMQTRSNIRAVFRAAEAEGLLRDPLPPRILKPRTTQREWLTAHGESNPWPLAYRAITKKHYALHHDLWPPDIVQGWQHYQAECSEPIRDVTFAKYARELSMFFGWVKHVVGREPVWEDLFNPAQVKDFVRWHGRRLKKTVTAHGRHTARDITTIAKVIGHPAWEDLARYSSKLKLVTALHKKEHHMISLATLDEVARALMEEGRAPLVRNRALKGERLGLHRARTFQTGLMLALLVRVPLRQRNLREMKFTNLFQDRTNKDHWILHFEGDELKVSHRGAEVNTYHLDLTAHCPAWCRWLEEWLKLRPLYPNADTLPNIFLTQYGTAYRVEKLYQTLSVPVSMRTGVRWYPHIARTMWATEFLRNGGDVITAAVMLGDTVQMVLKAYAHILAERHHDVASTFLAGRITEL